MYTYFVSSIDRVVDGDTVDVIIDLGFDLTKKERVRLAGIDTPESRTRDLEEKAMGLEAKDHLTGMLEAADELIVRTEKEGKYGRMLGWFYKDQESKYSINEVMVEQGYAWEYDGGKKEKDLQTLRDRRKAPDE